MEIEDVEHFFDDWRTGLVIVFVLVAFAILGLIIWWAIREHLGDLLVIVGALVGIVLGSLLLAFIGHLARDIFNDRSHRR